MTQQPPESLAKKSIELAVVINSFNRLPLLRESLPSIVQALKFLPFPSAIVVFDAGSTDGSIEFVENLSVRTQSTQIFSLCPSAETDRCFSAGCNYAMQFAAQQFPQLKWCLLFETDNLIVNQSALPLAVKLLEQEEKLAAVGFTVEKYDGNKTGFGCRFPTPLSFLLGQQLSQKLGLETMPINQWHLFENAYWGVSDIVFTSPLLIRYSAWKDTEGMDAARFPFSECDNDWCWTVYKKGWRVAVFDISGVIHDNRMKFSEWSGKRVINFHQARLRLLLKHTGQWITWLKPLLFMRHCLEFFLLTIRAVYSQQAKKSLEQRQDLIFTVFNEYEIKKVPSN